MCTVEKILIKGIRSFSPDNNYIIEFYKPLTIIVGSNGAGKTTIIECLRNATTGELPPNTRQGQGFVHDPKVAGETEVKGQIKLQFRTATGSPIIVTRSFLLTQKKTALQFKSLDAVLTATNKDTGARETLTYRCADLDRMVPTLMGVSKAVLENVIFVHQEESNWPLAEGKVLKDKFDDIFAATKYTKALEALRKLRLEKAQGLKEMRLTTETLKQVRDMAAHHTRERDAAAERVSECRGQLGGLEAEIRSLEEQRAAAAAALEAVEAHARDTAAKRGQLAMLRAQNEERRARFEAEGRADFEEGDEELRAHLAGGEAAAAARRAEAERLRREAAAERIQAAALQERLQREYQRQGKLSGEAAAAATAVAERDRAIRAAATALDLALPPLQGGQEAGGYTAEAAAAFRTAVDAKVRELDARIVSLRAAARSTEVHHNTAVDGATSALARAQEAVRLKRQQLADNRAAVSGFAAQIQSSQVTEVAARSLREEAAELGEVYKRKMSEEAGAGLPLQLEEQRGAAEAAGRRIADLRAERHRAAAAAEGGAKLRLKRMDLASRQEQLSTALRARHRELVAQLRLEPPGGPEGPLPEPPQLRQRTDSLLAAARAEEAARRGLLQEAQRQMAEAKHKHSARAAELSRCTADLDRLRLELRRGVAAAMAGQAAAEADDLNNAIAQAQEHEALHRNALGQASAMAQVYGAHHTQVAEGGPCPTCCRPFSPPERDVCLEHLNNEMQNLPREIAKLEADTAALVSRLAALRRLQPAWTRLSDLRERLPALREAVAEAEAEAEEAENRADGAQLDAVEAAQRAGELARFREEVVLGLERGAAECEALRWEVAQLEPSGAPAAGPPPRSVADVDGDLEAAELTRQQAEQRREMLQARANRLRSDVLAAQSEALQAQARAAEAAAALQRVGELQGKIRDLEAANAALETELAAAAASLPPLEAERRRLAEAREAARREAAAEVAEVEGRLRDAQLHAAALASRCRPVDEYEARGRGRELEAVGRAVAETEAAARRAAAAVAEKEAALADVERDLAADEATRRDITDVLDMRQTAAAEAALEAELAEAEQRAGLAGDAPSLQRRVAELGSRREGLRSRADQLRGHAAAGAAAAAKSQAELNDPKYRDIARRFTEQQVGCKTLELALGDMDKYYKALEKALLVFHTSKMADINAIIKELWQKTYRGQDIDYIQIKADTEGAGARSYNYRVVMYSGSAELEMRGRCSAGQKVLACLIIRLALAETFCLNCGILALDEPTTNLDAENSASLAEALRSLMVSRSGQENFQLIVITHDERFARLIGTREHVEALWRVTKDAQQHTQVLPEEVGAD